jgi:hypothetical protein
MKKTLYITLLICPFLFYNCGPDNPLKPKDPEPDTLPPITTEGLNTAGCLIDGEVWLPKPGGAFKPAIDCEYYPRIEGSDPRRWGVLQLDLANYNQSNYMYIGYDSLYTIGSKTIYLNGNSVSGSVGGGAEFRTSQLFWTTKNINNKLIILKLDTINQIISGTFQFDAINENDNNDTIKIREGRFDVKFTY